MEDSKLVENEPKVEIIEASAGIRQIIIETDGLNINLKKTECSQLELKEICREILVKLGS